MKNDILELGRIVNTHGIKGEIKIQPWCDDPEIFDSLEYLYINSEKYKIIQTRPHKNCVITKLDGVDNIDSAEMLRNRIVTVEREMLGELPEGTYYIADIEGLEVKTADGRVLGKIKEIIKTGSNDVYVIDNDTKKPYLIPVIDQVVKEVNIDGGYVLIELMEGLID